MKASIIVQPEIRLGDEVLDILNSTSEFESVIFVSAFVTFRTILRLRQPLLKATNNGTNLKLVIGIDLGGTSREVLEELLTWKCEVVVVHNSTSWATFHPKIYLFQRAESASLIIGSNNLTEGGFYTNSEASAKLDFSRPTDEKEFQSSLSKLNSFLNPSGGTAQHLSQDLIDKLIQRGELPSEDEARKARRAQSAKQQRMGIPASPFTSLPPRRAPLLPESERQREPSSKPPPPSPVQEPQELAMRPEGVLVWQKALSASDVLDTQSGSNQVGGLRLTQAGFEHPPGKRIDQTVYFRELFCNYSWTRERGRNRKPDQERSIVPIRVIIERIDYGIIDFEISHKPSGEANQGNYTTILRWGSKFSKTIKELSLTGQTLCLFETENDSAQFLIEITKPS